MKKYSFIEITSWIFGAVGFVVLIGTYLDHRIEQKITNPVYLNKIASMVRPALIFDSNGSITC